MGDNSLQIPLTVISGRHRKLILQTTGRV